jgi:hypothetical protein
VSGTAIQLPLTHYRLVVSQATIRDLQEKNKEMRENVRGTAIADLQQRTVLCKVESGVRLDLVESRRSSRDSSRPIRGFSLRCDLSVEILLRRQSSRVNPLIPEIINEIQLDIITIRA